jgi:hypothetical protein
MTRTMSLGKKPGYIRDGMLAGIIKGVIASLKGGVTKGGNPTRVGRLSSTSEGWFVRANEKHRMAANSSGLMGS